MPVLILKKVDSENCTSSFPTGEHVIGRGPGLLCNSKKVSRNHGLLKVTESEGISLRAIHNNPCFYQSNTKKSVTVVTYGNTVQINHDDLIAMSLDHGWFLVQIYDNDPNAINDQANINIEAASTDNDNHQKRSSNDSLNETPTKKLRTGDTGDITVKTEPLDEQVLNVHEGSSSTENIPITTETEEIAVKLEPLNENEAETTVITPEPLVSEPVVKTEPLDETVSTSSASNPDLNSNCEITVVKKESNDKDLNSCENAETDTNKVEDKANGDKDGKDTATTSGTASRVWRDRCWYGNFCYRKNSAHRIAFRHPGDSDYESDPNDSRPTCCYGINCYRKNKDHRRRYRHPGQVKLGQRPAPKRRKAKPKKPRTDTDDSNDLPAKRKTAAQSYADSDDDYDFSDPFINDGSSDDYEPSPASETESDFEDEDNSQSQEDRKRMLNEANKFMKKK